MTREKRKKRDDKYVRMFFGVKGGGGKMQLDVDARMLLLRIYRTERPWKALNS